MSNIELTPGLQQAKVDILNSKPTTTVVNLRTGEIKEAPRTLWLENRGLMMLFGFAMLAIVIAQSCIYGSFVALQYINWTDLDVKEQFWFCTWLVMSWSAYMGAFWMTYGIRSRTIAKALGQPITMQKGGWAMMFGLIGLVIVIVAYVGFFVLLGLEEHPFDSNFWEEDASMIVGIVSFCIPVLAACGGIALAKGIRGRDTVALSVK